MKRSDILATLIMVVYISVGVFCGIEFEKLNTDPKYADFNFILGFILSVCLLGVTHFIWLIIKSYIED